MFGPWRPEPRYFISTEKKKEKKKANTVLCLFDKRVLKMSFLENPLLYSVQMHDSKKKVINQICEKKMAILTNKDFSLLYSMCSCFQKLYIFTYSSLIFHQWWHEIVFLLFFFQAILCWGAGSISIYKLLNTFNLKMTQCTTICLEPVSNKAWYRHFAWKN